MTLFSIIVPVYNTAKYLESCLDSILCQTVHDFEVLLIDDGSTDSSGVICDKYALKDKRVRVFHKKNGGVSSARNLALENMRGEWFLFVDSDDEIAINTLEVCANYLNKGGIDILQFNYSRDKNRLGFPKAGTAILPIDKYLVSNDYLICAGCSVISGNYAFVNKVRFREDLNLAEDQLFIYDCFNLAHYVIRIPDTLYYYRRNENGAVSLSKSLDMLYSSRALIEYKKNCLFIPMIDRILLLFIIEIIRNRDIPYVSVKQLYLSCEIQCTNRATPFCKLFHFLAKVSFKLAYGATQLYYGI